MSLWRPRSSNSPRFAVAVAVLGLASAMVGPLPFASTRLAGQIFRASVDLIAVDVQVTDSNGRSVTTLGPDSFEVSLDGRRRRVVSATFTKYDLVLPPDGPFPLITPLDSERASGAAGPPARTFIIAIDSGSFRSLDVRVATLAAERFTRGLNPQDSVGVLVLPDGPRLAPSTSHASARQFLGTVVGRKPSSGQFEMSVEEVVDITAAMANQSQLASRNTISQIVAAGTGPGEASDGMECSGPLTACTEQAMGEAMTVAVSLEREVLQGIAGLDTLLRELQNSPGRKSVLLLSGGMPVSDRSGGRPSLAEEVKRLGEQATYANATINAIYFDPSVSTAFSVGGRRPGGISGRARGIYTRALSEFSEPSGGMLLVSSTGAAESEIDRILAHTSSYYVLGVEPDARDRDGRPHRLQVKTRERNVTLRSRQLVIVPKLVN